MSKTKMRLNERNVAYFASCNSPIDKEGILNKRGESSRFHRRYFVLKGNLLFYFDKKGDKEPIGLIILEGCRIELADMDDNNMFQISFPGEGVRSYALGANSQDEMESWMKVLSCASYEYMKAMVIELQRQLDELSHNDSNIAAARQSHRYSQYTPSRQDNDSVNGARLSDVHSHSTGSLDEIRDNPMPLPGSSAVSIYDKGKTESLAHTGAPRRSPFHSNRNSEPEPVCGPSRYNNPAYDIWNPIDDDGPVSDTLSSSTSSSRDSEYEELPDGRTRPVSYENVPVVDIPQPRATSRLSSATSMIKKNNPFSRSAPPTVTRPQQTVYIDGEKRARSFAELHQDFGVFIVRMVNESRHKRTLDAKNSNDSA
ncbi:uncharacterized protein LOC117104349 [Anneissia japonica]|uniref:uncharacterized protein LOC117104349 n=1 Tax=Anneissia japonica TaxID=1529436 RepID=UPI0014256660|nr:uncharacterized protein LOC117104349 [Anneissia japonica]